VEQEVAEAITAAREAVLRVPSDGKAWGRLGDNYFVHDFMGAAAQCYARAEELDPESLFWPYRLGFSLAKDRPELAAAPLERSLRSLDNHAPRCTRASSPAWAGATRPSITTSAPPSSIRRDRRPRPGSG
jgi:tetratricopeptide (TPR) repeat protein